MQVVITLKSRQCKHGIKRKYVFKRRNTEKLRSFEHEDPGIVKSNRTNLTNSGISPFIHSCFCKQLTTSPKLSGCSFFRLRSSKNISLSPIRYTLLFRVEQSLHSHPAASRYRPIVLPDFKNKIKICRIFYKKCMYWRGMGAHCCSRPQYIFLPSGPREGAA